MTKTDFVVRFGGVGGQGFLSAAVGFASAHAQAGYHTLTFSVYPSQITGGPTWNQVRISTSPILGSGETLDVLVAFNESAYETHKDDVKEGGVVLYDSDAFQLEDEGRSLGIAFDKLGRSTGNPRAANMVMMGALAELVDIHHEILEEFVRKRWANTARYGESVVPQNIKALSLGREAAAKSGFSLGQLEDPVKPNYEQIFVNGNEAICLGAVHAGLQFYVGYPISPATAILIWMEENLVGRGGSVHQASSELEAINALIGAGYAGVKAMSATSGPGFSLMNEGLGMAWMAEIPLVLVDVQRGGPGTGLPTKTEQSDLLNAVYPSHGDVSMPVIAPGTVEECFYATVMAFNWAERYQGPVMLLGERSLSERQQNIPKPDLNRVSVENRVVYQGANGYQRYEARGVSPMPIPGNPGSYVANGSEHDGLGDTTHLPSRHIQMTERRFNKLELLKDGTYEVRNPGSPIAIMPWGGSKGPALESYELLTETGENLGWYYTMFLNPLPARLLEELKRKELVLVPELNYLGHFSALLRSYGVRAESITQYTGLPFKVSDLYNCLLKRVREETRERVMV